MDVQVQVAIEEAGGVKGDGIEVCVYKGLKRFRTEYEVVIVVAPGVVTTVWADEAAPPSVNPAFPGGRLPSVHSVDRRRSDASAGMCPDE